MGTAAMCAFAGGYATAATATGCSRCAIGFAAPTLRGAGAVWRWWTLWGAIVDSREAFGVAGLVVKALAAADCPDGLRALSVDVARFEV